MLMHIAKLQNFVENKAIVGSRLIARCVTHDKCLMVFIFKQYLVAIDPVVSTVVLYSRRLTCQCSIGPITCKHNCIQKTGSS